MYIVDFCFHYLSESYFYVLKVATDLSTKVGGQCNDDDICSTITFTKAGCDLHEVKEMCCASCITILKCHDEIVCERYQPISSLCTISKEVREQCPESCGLCSKHSKYFLTRVNKVA